jgi:hypothetical protein
MMGMLTRYSGMYCNPSISLPGEPLRCLRHGSHGASRGISDKGNFPLLLDLFGIFFVKELTVSESTAAVRHLTLSWRYSCFRRRQLERPSTSVDDLCCYNEMGFKYGVMSG